MMTARIAFASGPVGFWDFAGNSRIGSHVCPLRETARSLVLKVAAFT